jgi:hypothetical protein
MQGRDYFVFLRALRGFRFIAIDSSGAIIYARGGLMRNLGLPLFIIVVCASTLFAQDQPTAKNSHAAIATPTDPVVNSSTTPNPEPWRIIQETAQEPGQPSAQAGNESLLNIVDGNAQAFPFTPSSRPKRILSSEEVEQLAKRVLHSEEVEQLMNGNTCYSIRSYLMARDSKDSDSTHLVSTSTCQPAQRYTVKTTDLRPHLLQR